MTDRTLPEPDDAASRLAAHDAYRRWRIGDRFEGRLDAALHAYAAAERARIGVLVDQWREGAKRLASSNPAWSSHFYDCANELERLIGPIAPEES